MEQDRKRHLALLLSVVILAILLFYLVSQQFFVPFLEVGVEPEGQGESLEGNVVFQVWNTSISYELLEDWNTTLEYFQYISRYIYNSDDGNTSVFWFENGELKNMGGGILRRSRLDIKPLTHNVYELGYGAAFILSLVEINGEKTVILHSTILDNRRWDSLLSNIIFNETEIESIGWIIWLIRFDVDRLVYIDGVGERLRTLYVILEQPFYLSNSGYLYENIPEMMYWSIVARPALSIATGFLYDENNEDIINYLWTSKVIVGRFLEKVYPGFGGFEIPSCETPSKYLFNLNGNECYQIGGAAAYILSYGLGIPTAYVDDENARQPVKPWSFIIAFSRIYELDGVLGISFMDLDGDGTRDVFVPMYGKDINMLPLKGYDEALSGKQILVLNIYRPTMLNFLGLGHSSLIAYFGIEEYLKNLPEELQTPWTKVHRHITSVYGSIYIVKSYDFESDTTSPERRWMGWSSPLPNIYGEGLFVPTFMFNPRERRISVSTSPSPAKTFLGSMLDSSNIHIHYRCTKFCDASQFREPVLAYDFQPLENVNRLNVSLVSYTFKWTEEGRLVYPNLLARGSYKYGDTKIHLTLNAYPKRITLLIGEEVRNEASNFTYIEPIPPKEVFLYLRNGSVITLKSSDDTGISHITQTVVIAGVLIPYDDYGLTFNDVLGSHLIVNIELGGKMFQFILSFPINV